MKRLIGGLILVCVCTLLSAGLAKLTKKEEKVEKKVVGTVIIKNENVALALLLLSIAVAVVAAAAGVVAFIEFFCVD